MAGIRSEKYGAGIMSESPWFLEFKKMVFLLNDGLIQEEIKRRCVEENLFGMKTERRVLSVYSYLARRTRDMDRQLIGLFCSSDLATQKLINLIMVVSGDRLFFEFLNEVYREKCILGFEMIDKTDINSFFRDKALVSEELSAWKDTTVSKVQCSFTNFMTDANLLQRDKKCFWLTPPLIDIALERYLQATDQEPLLKAITGVR